MKKSVTILICFLALYHHGWSQQVNKLIQEGNDHYKQQQFDQAANQFNKALEKEPSNTTAKFNLANSLYKQDKQDDAAKLFTGIADEVKETGPIAIGFRSKAYYNKGVILSKQKKLEESIETYKNALRQNPDDIEARDNLQKALFELRKKNPPKKKEENKKKQDQKKQQKQQQSKMSPKEAEQRLKLLEQKEKEVQQRLQKEKAKAGGGQAKDW